MTCPTRVRSAVAVDSADFSPAISILYIVPTAQVPVSLTRGFPLLCFNIMSTVAPWATFKSPAC